MAWRASRVAKPAGLVALYYKVFRCIVLQSIRNEYKVFVKLYYFCITKKYD